MSFSAVTICICAWLKVCSCRQWHAAFDCMPGLCTLSQAGSECAIIDVPIVIPRSGSCNGPHEELQFCLVAVLQSLPEADQHTDGSQVVSPQALCRLVAAVDVCYCADSLHNFERCANSGLVLCWFSKALWHGTEYPSTSACQCIHCTQAHAAPLNYPYPVSGRTCTSAASLGLVA